ncbi:MAG TPA: hypothetical protein PKZ76_02490 [Xanthomonadaceae bacterium]|nr:hypothetical protein [Xanthomonadaceae bacterium]
MAVLQGILLLVLGVGLLLVDWNSLRTGWLPCGSNGFKGTLKYYRHERPAAFWLMFALYGFGGLWLVVFALRLLAGNAEPLPLN